MGNIIKNGVSKKVFFSAANYYGANLKVDVLNDDDSTYIVNKVPMTEISEPVDAYSGTTSGAAVKDVKVIVLTDVTGLIASDRVSIGNEIYRITAVNAATNEITLHRGLVADVADGTAVDRVGNMGIYKINLFVTVPEGAFIIQAKDTKYGLQLSDSITVKDNSLEDLFEITNSEINENERVIRETSSYTIII